MSELGLAGAVLLASLTLTYLFCLRPMRRGRCAMGAGRRGRGQDACEMSDRDAEVARLRQEVAALRAGSAPASSRAPGR